ncbi:cellular tumor antigen p53-like [Penaeus monodon]|uniref:cellular tumor antigen p53-like n=1 Tax=Penaeus monodon TaxID=6687 RepID=UPI0018A71D50|nr:cellular tumor antigen p53-like [Penaeus monodon]
MAVCLPETRLEDASWPGSEGLGQCYHNLFSSPLPSIGHIVGRKVVDVRVCACPTRDIRTDENAAQNKGKRKCSSLPLSPHLTKKKFRAVEPKIEPKEESDETYTITVSWRLIYDMHAMSTVF